jgi:hypothetical protein
MKKQSIIILIVVASLALLSSGVPGAAKSKKIKFKVEMCRETPSLFTGDITCPGGTPIVNDDGIITGCEDDAKYHVRGQQNLWVISEGDDNSNGDEFVVGQLILDFNGNCDGPPPLGNKHCPSWGTFELIPSAYCNEFGQRSICTDISGSWVGSFTACFHEGYSEMSLEGEGTGDLDGLKIKAYDFIPAVAPSICGRGSRPLTGYIYPDDDKDDEDDNLSGWGSNHDDD